MSFEMVLESQKGEILGIRSRCFEHSPERSWEFPRVRVVETVSRVGFPVVWLAHRSYREFYGVPLGEKVMTRTVGVFGE